MNQNNIILNLGLKEILKFLNGGRYDGFFGPMLMIWDSIFNKEKVEEEKLKKKNDTIDVSSKKTKTASTSSLTTSTSPLTTLLSLTSSSSVASSSTTTNPNSYMDWITSEYGDISSKDSLNKAKTSSEFVWEDETLPKVDTGVTMRELKSLLNLLDLYNLKLSEIVGQKRN